MRPFNSGRTCAVCKRSTTLPNGTHKAHPACSEVLKAERAKKKRRYSNKKLNESHVKYLVDFAHITDK